MMNRAFLVAGVFAIMVAPSTAFTTSRAPVRSLKAVQPRLRQMTMDTYWEGGAPPSTVLGPGNVVLR